MTINFILSIIIQYIAGVILLWLCSKTVNTPQSNLKTAAIFTTIWMLLRYSLYGILYLCMNIDTGLSLAMAILAMFITLVLQFKIMTWIYGISFFSALWLIFAMWIAAQGLARFIALFK